MAQEPQEDPGAAKKETPPSDAWYSVDEEKLSALRTAKPWTKDPTHFRKVMVSPTACVKMLMHSYSGCEEGIKQGGKPLEVMGMMLGCPHSEIADALVVTDVFPLPVTGFETRVVADDENVINYMIELAEIVEKSRKERLFGWYHSHPFDVDEEKNHCFLSSTDLSTQLAWQNAEDGNGNPFLAIVIDPLRSFAKNKAEIGAFRAYPPSYSPPSNMAPDFSTITDEAKALEKWGSCWQRYYELKIEYFMSSQAKRIIDTLNHSFLWTRTLGTVPPALEPNHKSQMAERLSSKVTEKLLASASNSGDFPHGGDRSGDKSLRHHPSAGEARPPKPFTSASERPDRVPNVVEPRSVTGGPPPQKDGAIAKAANAATGIALEELHAQLIQSTKRTLLQGPLIASSFDTNDSSASDPGGVVPMATS